MAFTKNDLVAAFAANKNIAKAQAERDIEFLFNEINKAVVVSGEDFRLPVIGGTLKKIVVPAHEARNPATGGTVQVKEKFKVKLVYKPQEV